MNNMGNIKMEELIRSARRDQQVYFEHGRHWVTFRPESSKYAKQSISWAIHGMKITENGVIVITNAEDVADELIYNGDKRRIVDMLLERIRKYHISTKCEVICNTIIPHDQKYTRNTRGNKARRKTPIFKIIVYKDNKGTQKNRIERLNNVQLLSPHEFWYMDINGRIYKSWDDYMNNNTLPKCTMIVPKGGTYQPDPVFEMLGANPTVWVEIAQSPACNLSKEILKYADIGCKILGIGGAVASLVTHLGPTAVTADLVTSGVTGIWTVSRWVQVLRDRYAHEESIQDSDVMKAWLSIAGSILGVAVSVGAYAITRSVERGAAVGKIWQFLYNTALLGDIAVNALGIAHQGYYLCYKYRKGRIERIDLLTFASHLLFFVKAAINCKFASNIIASTQGNILRDNEAMMRNEKLRTSYSHVNTDAAVNSSNEIPENAEIICNIRNINIPVNLISDCHNSFSKIALQFKNSEVKVNDTKLVDPKLFVNNLISEDELSWINENKSLNNVIDNNPGNYSSPNFSWQLREKIVSHSKDIYPTIKALSKVKSVMNEIRFVDRTTEIFTKVLFAPVTLCEKFVGSIFGAVWSVWDFFTESIKQTATNVCSFFSISTVVNIIEQIFLIVYAILRMIICGIASAFKPY